MTQAVNPPFVEVRFLRGENKRFFGARKAAEESGYPDIPTYLYATGRVKGWCEVVPEELVRVYLKAEECRRECLRTAYKLKLEKG